MHVQASGLFPWKVCCAVSFKGKLTIVENSFHVFASRRAKLITEPDASLLTRRLFFVLFLSHRYLHLSVLRAVWSSQRADLGARRLLCVLAQHGGGPHPDPDGGRHGWMDHEHLLGNGHGHPGKSVPV